jgi:VIT1/CCC1 family predicted Fe2+/Mn2+ transporter
MEEPKLLNEWKGHWQDETDAHYLYGALATLERDPRRRDVFARLADLEGRHVEIWAKLLAENGVRVGTPRPSLKARLQARVAKRFGPKILLNALLREEGHEVVGYLDLHDRSEPGKGKEAAMLLAKESAEHAEQLQTLTGGEGEPWHSMESGALLRNVVYGFNDGLTANFGLVAGVLGAASGNEVILISGVAGSVADALSMGASGYLAAKSEQEVHDKEIELERREIALMPDLEREELKLLYEAKGFEPQRAEALAADIMSSPERALEEKVREELKIGEPGTTPLREGIITGTATAVGALIPVLPFVFLGRTVAIWTSFIVAMASHFGVGGARSLFTGRGIFRSGFDMFVVGIGVAGVGYLIGSAIEGFL